MAQLYQNWHMQCASSLQIQPPCITPGHQGVLRGPGAMRGGCISRLMCKIWLPRNGSLGSNHQNSSMFFFADFLRAIYTVRLCRMRQAYDRPTTRIVSCKSNLQLAYDCRVRHKKCDRILKHDLKSYDNRRMNDESCVRFFA